MTLNRPLIIGALLGALSLSTVSFTAHAAETRPSVKAMAEIVATGFRHGAIPSLQKEGASDASIRCLRGLTGNDFAEAIEGVLTSSLTPAEIAEVDAYVSGPVGKREFEVILMTMRRQAGEEALDLPALTEEETRQVVAFQETPVARKFMGALESSMRTPEIPGSVGHRMFGLLGECEVL